MVMPSLTSIKVTVPKHNLPTPAKGIWIAHYTTRSGHLNASLLSNENVVYLAIKFKGITSLLDMYNSNNLNLLFHAAFTYLN